MMWHTCPGKLFHDPKKGNALYLPSSNTTFNTPAKSGPQQSLEINTM